MKEKSSDSTGTTVAKAGPRLKQPKAFLLAIFILAVVAGMFLWQRREKSMAQNAVNTPEATDALMHQKPIAGEGEFIEQMIPHHQEAIDSSKYILENSDNADLKAFAQDVITNQSKEVWTMVGFYQIWYDKAYPGAVSYVRMMPDLTQLSGRELDKAYIEGMIQHHKAAIQMAKAILGITQKQELRTVANNIVDTQEKELTKLMTWLKDYQN